MYDSSSKPVGTVRYLAPEYLKPELFNEYLNLTRADIYSTALVIWELLNRTKVRGIFLTFFKVFVGFLWCRRTHSRV